MILALTVAALLGASVNDTAIAIAIVFIPSFVRVLRGQVIAVREENYIEAARSLGATSPRLIRRHVVPNVASPLIIQVSLSLGFALLTEAGLSYLGIGEQPPTPSWGAMMNEGYSFIFTTPWALVFPGLVIMLDGPLLQPGGRRAARLAGPGTADELEPGQCWPRQAAVPPGPAAGNLAPRRPAIGHRPRGDAESRTAHCSR